MNTFPLLTLLAFGTSALSLLSSLVDTGEQEVVEVSVRHNSGEASVATSFVLLETFGVGGVELNLARLCRDSTCGASGTGDIDCKDMASETVVPTPSSSSM